MNALKKNDKCIEYIAEFIKKYVNGETGAIPSNLYANEQSRWTTFNGIRPKGAQCIEIKYRDEMGEASSVPAM